MADALLEAVRGLRVADPGLGFKPLLAKLQEQQPDLEAGTREVCEVLVKVLKAEGEAKAAATLVQAVTATTLPAADEGDAPSLEFKLKALHAKLNAVMEELNEDLTALGERPSRKALMAVKAKKEAYEAEIEAAFKQAKIEAAEIDAAIKALPATDAALSLACIGCARLPSDMDDEREKHPICDKCRDEKLPTTYLCGEDCPANPGAWQLHGVFHKKLRKERKRKGDVGATQQWNRDAAEEQARRAAQSGDKWDEIMAEGARCASKLDWRRAAKACREAIVLRPDQPNAYINLGHVLSNSGHVVEASQRFLEAKERYPMGSEEWGEATAEAFVTLKLEECDQVAKPEWWNDEGLKALSARVLRAAPNEGRANEMRAMVLSGKSGGWIAGPRSVAEVKEAATHFDRAAALANTSGAKAEYASLADKCRSMVDGV